MNQNIEFWLIFIPVMLFGITIHEFAHAWTADLFGDPTARLMGRVTLNPIAHFDPVGALFIVIVAATGFGFGWGKPVPVNPNNLRHPRRDDIFISAAGPASNLIAAAVFGLLFHALGPPADPDSVVGIIHKLAFMAVWLNVSLAVFNLIPVHPLDGSHVLAGLLPRPAAAAYERLSAAGPTILIGVIMFGWFAKVPILGMILGPPVTFLTDLFTGRSLF